LQVEPVATQLKEESGSVTKAKAEDSHDKTDEKNLKPTKRTKKHKKARKHRKSKKSKKHRKHRKHSAPATNSLLMQHVRDEQDLDKFSQTVQVPIDEPKSIIMKLSPTYKRDRIGSVTLNSFRKVIGYDTFNSIL